MTQWFKDVRASENIIVQTRKSKNWTRLKQTLKVLQQANKERVSCSKNGRRVQVLRSHEMCEAISEDGRYLVTPPLVGRDAVALQDLLDKHGYSTVVLCREPVTQFGLCPVVTLGETTTVRVQVEEPINPERPTAEWFDYAMNELGQTVVEKVDTLATYDRKLDYLLGHLGAVPGYGVLYKTIDTICDALIGATE